MTEIPFEQMPPGAQRAEIQKVLSSTFGDPEVKRLWQQMEPLIRNRVGHGEPLAPRMPGEADDPRNNHWKGVWQIYHAK